RAEIAHRVPNVSGRGGGGGVLVDGGHEISPLNTVIPGRCEASSYGAQLRTSESRDSGSGPSDHPGMTKGKGRRRTSRTHRLDIVAVGIEQERGVVGRAVVVPMSGSAIVAAAGFQALGMEFSDRGMVGCAKGDMRAAILQALLQIEPQRRLALRAE